MGYVRFASAMLLGCVSAVIVARVGFALMIAGWPAYAAAAPIKAFTLSMLFARLALAVVITVISACVATLVARDDGRIGWWLGALFLALSLPSHLHTVWNDYPVWYHFVYLAGLVPIAGASARGLRGWWPVRPAGDID